jgi:hypothetical protein
LGNVTGTLFHPLPERRINDPLIVVASRLIVRKRARFHRFSQRLSACLLSAIALASVSAAEPGALEPAPSIYDKIWRYAEWYNDKDNPLIQSFRFTGRFQLDYALVEADQGNHDEWNIRRFRLGGGGETLPGIYAAQRGGPQSAGAAPRLPAPDRYVCGVEP